MWWTVHLEGGPRRVNHAAVAVGERIFSFGGYCTGDNYKDKTPIDIFVLNTTTYRWVVVPKPIRDSDECDDWPYQRYGHTVSKHGDKIYLFGGRNDLYPCNVLFCFDTRTYVWSRPAVSGDVPVERDGHSACVIADAMYIFGGYEDTLSRFGLDVYRLDLNTFSWTLLACTGELPIYRDFHSATAIGSAMYVFGGRSDMSDVLQGNHLHEYYCNKVSVLDTKTLTWFTPTIQPPLPIGRRSHSAINLDDKLLIFGGYNSRSDDHKNDLWILDPEAWTWRQVSATSGHGPNPRRRQAMCLVGHRLFLFGGTSPYDGPPIQFTAEQQEFLPETENASAAKLVDHNDLYVLDLAPSLKTLCFMAVLRHKIAVDGRSGADVELPHALRRELAHMVTPNSLSKPLKTIRDPLG